jgi:hypothetical protein
VSPTTIAQGTLLLPASPEAIDSLFFFSSPLVEALLMAPEVCDFVPGFL